MDTDTIKKLTNLNAKKTESNTKSSKLKTIYVGILAFCLVCIIIVALASSRYFLSFSTSDATFTASVKNDVSYKVHYLENNFFDSSERPQNLCYLMSFTDYIGIDNTFLAEFSRETDMSYLYKATETLLIKHQSGSDHSANPVVHQEETTLYEIAGEVTGERIYYMNNIATNRLESTYTIYPQKYIRVYKDFIEEQHKQMRVKNAVVDKPQGFSAELMVNFTYVIKTGDNNISETIMRGLNILLSNEVYLPVLTGTPDFYTTIPLREFKMPGIRATILLTCFVVICISGICYSVQQLMAEPDLHRRELKKILKKYSDEIINTKSAVELSGNIIIMVPEFQELLKLAVNRDVHILYFSDNVQATFCAVVDGYAYCFNINFSTEKADIKKDEDLDKS